MALSDLASIGSLVSGIAVLISLIYLSLQVRQAEKNQRALMNQGAISRVSETIMGFAQPTLNSVSTKVQSGDTNLSAQEINQLRFMLRVSLLSLQDVMVQHREGLVDHITFENSVGALRSILSLPVYRAIWLRNKGSYAREMAEFVDDLIKKTPRANAVDIVAQFKSDLATVMY